MTIINEIDYAELEKRIVAGLEEHHFLHDPHRERAAKHFCIPIEEVTDKERKVYKDITFMSRYYNIGNMGDA